MSSKLAPTTQIYALNPELKKYDVNTIYQWLDTQPHLPQLLESQVCLFLHSCYYDIERTKITIEKYLTLRTRFELFNSSSEKVLKRNLNACVVDVLPKLTPEGYTVWMFKLLDPRVENFDCVEKIRAMIMSLCLHFHLRGPSNGLVLLCDVGNFSFGHVFKLSVSAVKQVLQFLQEAVPTRVRGIHCINVVSATKRLIELMRPFMKKEVYDLLKMHPHSVETVYEYVPKECLPRDYGGELESVQDLHDKNVENVLRNLDFFEWHDGQRVDESKRKKTKSFLGSVFFGKSE